MEITLYKTTSDRKQVSKRVTDGLTRIVTRKGSYQLENPVFILTRGEDEYFVDYNYLYCKELNTWYYCEITLIPCGMAQIDCTIDPLMTHRNEIYGLTCFVERQENITNPYFTDPLLPIAQGTIIDTIDVGAVGSASDSRTMYFTCIGGVESV